MTEQNKTGICRSVDKQTFVEVKFDMETIWLSQKQKSVLFKKEDKSYDELASIDFEKTVEKTVEVTVEKTVEKTSPKQIEYDFGLNAEKFRSIFGVNVEEFRSQYGPKLLLTVLNIYQKPEITAKEIAENISVTNRSAENYLKRLKQNRIIKRIGSDKTGHWEIIDKGPISQN